VRAVARETFGMVIAEANAAARPVVVWDLEPMASVAAPGCPRVPAFDTAAWSRATLALLERGDDELAALGRRCREWARRFHWDEVAAAQERVYLEVAGRAAARAG
jgi:glycosyltransferase involved in cell wall biosynthesis